VRGLEKGGKWGMEGKWGWRGVGKGVGRGRENGRVKGYDWYNKLSANPPQAGCFPAPGADEFIGNKHRLHSRLYQYRYLRPY